MSRIRRLNLSGHLYFTTHVTYQRLPILVENVDLFWRAEAEVRRLNGFESVAWSVLPYHLHLLIDPAGSDLSDSIKRIKLKFSGLYRSRYGLTSGRLWQYRFWDHVIRDEEDLYRHLDYIHYNAVKHGYAQSPGDWPHSSFAKFLELGYYPKEWGKANPVDTDEDFGE